MNEHSEVLAIFQMTEAMAGGIARSIQRAAPFDYWLAGSSAPSSSQLDIESEYLPEGRRNARRFTFVCPVDPTCFLALSVCRFDTDKGPEQISAAQEIHGWVDGHIRLLWKLKHDRGRAEMFAQAFDLFDFGTFLLDADGSILFANERARHLLDRGDGLRRAGQSVTAADFDTAVRLQTAIQHLSRIEHGSASEIAGPSLMLIRRANPGPLVAILARLADIESGNAAATTALYVLDPEIDTGPLGMALCRAYGLTAMEAGLVVRLVRGLTTDAAARELRIQTQTARAYLKQIFSKTDTHRQADLVRLILGGVVRIRSVAAFGSNGGRESRY
ncbi:helix-turn-helix transcriptional regulator [Rhizorhabdus argentea]|uniref:helix-turn-helix transcriptional regulator n=1 Tax=Rhizorhabdus argentea TaxID=1387174 RepID=UPI0030ECBECB